MNARDRSGSAGRAESKAYESVIVTPRDAVIATQVARARSPSRPAAAVKSAKNTKSLAPIWATE